MDGLAFLMAPLWLKISDVCILSNLSFSNSTCCFSRKFLALGRSDPQDRTGRCVYLIFNFEGIFLDFPVKFSRPLRTRFSLFLNERGVSIVSNFFFVLVFFALLLNAQSSALSDGYTTRPLGEKK